MQIIDFPKEIAVFLVKLYQKTLSPDHGPLRFLYPRGCCRFYPTCSQYTIDAFEHFGFLKGGFLALWRILRCHPWSKGGVDKVVKCRGRF